MATEMVTLPAEAIPSLRRMLVVGLASIAEIERVQPSPGSRIHTLILRCTRPALTNKADLPKP